MFSNKQLRLMRLDKFLNLYEVGFPTFNDSWGLGEKMKNIYVSSWINDSRESLSRWKLFSDLKEGVRIGINTQDVFDKSGNCEVSTIIPYSGSSYNKTLFQIKKPINNISVSSKINKIEQHELIRIINANYDELLDNNENLLKQYRLIESLLTTSINPISSQNEVRLQIEMSLPHCPYKKREIEEYERALRHDEFIEYILASLPDNFFDNIEIIVSPDFSKENFLLLQSFISKQGYTFQIQQSELTNLYKFYIRTQSLYDFAHK